MTIETIYVINHSHTDIGFTADQPILWELQARYIQTALDEIERSTQDATDESTFRWTVETLAVLEYWLQHASAVDIERLQKAEAAGFLEVTGMFLNITPLYGAVETLEALQRVDCLRRKFGFRITSAMNCDVNGQNWPLADLLLDAGIQGFSMAINHHFGGSPEPRPGIFRWQAPSGRCLPAFNGWAYGKAGEFGLDGETDERFLEWWPRAEAYLEKVNWPLPFIMLQGIHPFGDNAGINPNFARFAKRWNSSGRLPKVVSATPHMFWAAVQEHLDHLPVVRGDWTDYWNFGCGSSARETAIGRTNRTRLIQADGLYAIANRLPDGSHWSKRSFDEYREIAWHSQLVWGEHTWGADGAIGSLVVDDGRTMWNHKAHLAYQARSYSQLLLRDALADLACHVERSSPDDIMIFNSLPWPRLLAGGISHYSVGPRGMPADNLAGRHYQGHFEPPTSIGMETSDDTYLLLPTEVPGFGCAVARRDTIVHAREVTTTHENASIENRRYRLVFDREHGGVRSLFDKKLNCEWVDATAEYPFYAFVHEEVADRQHEWPRRLINDMKWQTTVETNRAWNPTWPANRTLPTALICHRAYHSPLGWAVEQEMNHPRVGKLIQRLFLPDYDDFIELESQWEMGLDTHPQASYIMLPFDLPGATVRFDSGGVPVIPEVDQIPGVCRDYFTIQNWVDFNNGQRGVTIACPENPLVQIGNFHFGQDQRHFHLERAMLLGWVTNNYWECNFPGCQPGLVFARYRLLPYEGAFNEAQAHRNGMEAAHRQLLSQHLGELPVKPTIRSSAPLLLLPQPPILVLHIDSCEDDMIVRLYNASDKPASATIGPGQLVPRTAWQCDGFKRIFKELSVEKGIVRLDLERRQTGVLRLAF